MIMMMMIYGTKIGSWGHRVKDPFARAGENNNKIIIIQ